jgi:hypothetical protein
LDIYWNILTMHVLINVKSPNNISKWQMGFNSAFKGLMYPCQNGESYSLSTDPLIIMKLTCLSPKMHFVAGN